MKSLSLIAFAGLILLSASRPSEEIIELPITFVDGSAGLAFSSGKLRTKQLTPDNSWYKTEQHIVTGIPTDWDNVVRQTIWLDGKQFAYQNYKQGLISEADFNDIKTSWNINLEKRPYSEKPIKCFVYAIVGKKSGVLKYKVDTNNNLDFSDESEYSAVKFKFSKLDSIVKNCSHQVKYEALRHGKVTPLTAPIVIVENYGSLWSSFPQHAIAELHGVKILISSQNFGSTNYDPASIIESTFKVTDPMINENEFITIGGSIYQNLGVNTDKQVLRLKKISNNNVVHSTQVGGYAIPFTGDDFVTQEKLSLEKYKGKFLFMDFWGTWCVPCVADLPNIKKAYASLDKTKIEFLGVANDKAEPLKKFLEKDKIQWKQILCEEEVGIIDDYKITGYPTSFLIDPNGKIIAKNLTGKNLTDTLNYYIREWHN